MWRELQWSMLQVTCEGGLMIQNAPCCLRQHSPLHEAAKPRWAADEPLRGVDPLQEVTREALDDGLHVGGTAPDELYHLQYHTGAQCWCG